MLYTLKLLPTFRYWNVGIFLTLHTLELSYRIITDIPIQITIRLHLLKSFLVYVIMWLSKKKEVFR